MKPTYSGASTSSCAKEKDRWGQSHLFKRYWQHYDIAMKWLQHHKELLEPAWRCAAPRATGVPPSTEFEQQWSGHKYGRHEYGSQEYGSQEYGSREYGGHKYCGHKYGGQQYGQQEYGGQGYGGGGYDGQEYGEPEYGEPEYGGHEFGKQEYGLNEYGGHEYGGHEYGEREYGGHEYVKQEYGEQEYGEQEYEYGGHEYGGHEYGEREYGGNEYVEQEYGEQECGEQEYEYGGHEYGEYEYGGQDVYSESEESGEEIEMIVTEDLIAFFEQSARHRKSLQAFRRANAQPQPAAKVESHQERRQRLYGQGHAADVLHCLETDLQLSFHKFIDMLDAQPWPNIPLKL